MRKARGMMDEGKGMRENERNNHSDMTGMSM